MNAKFLQISDIHLFAKKYNYAGKYYDANVLFEKMLDEIDEKHSDADFIIISGDLVDDGSLSGYEQLKKTLDNKLKIPAYLCLGNHDDRGNFNRVFSGGDAQKPYYYCKTAPCGKLNIIGLDSGKVNPWMGKIDENQLEWLKGELEKTSFPTIITMHHPPFFGEDIDSLLYQLENGAELYNIIKGHNILGIFSGHLHSAYSYFLGHIPCFTAGSVGFGLEFDENFESILTDDRSYNLCMVKQGQLVVKRCILR